MSDDLERKEESDKIGPVNEEQEREMLTALEQGKKLAEMLRTDGWQDILSPMLTEAFEKAFVQLKTANSNDACDYVRPQEVVKLIDFVFQRIQAIENAHKTAMDYFNRSTE